MRLSKRNVTDNKRKLPFLQKYLGHQLEYRFCSIYLNKWACVCGDLVNEIDLAQPNITTFKKN